MNRIPKNQLFLNKKSWVEQNDCGEIKTSNDGIYMANNVQNDTGHRKIMNYNEVHEMGCLENTENEDRVCDADKLAKNDHEYFDDMSEDRRCEQNVLAAESNEDEREMMKLMCIDSKKITDSVREEMNEDPDISDVSHADSPTLPKNATE